MIFHEHKCIFIHIPKCAGSSITRFFAPKANLTNETPDYNILFGWCPERKIHLQHATSKQLIETGLISKKQWDEYFKFTVVRNPWDRAYSDYLWMKKELGVEDSFQNFIQKKGRFSERLNNIHNIHYRGDHLLNQMDFFDIEGEYKMDFVCRFENLSEDLSTVIKNLNIAKPFNVHANKSKTRLKHYSIFYNKRRQELIQEVYYKDIQTLSYSFDDQKSFFEKFKATFL